MRGNLTQVCASWYKCGRFREFRALSVKRWPVELNSGTASLWLTLTLARASCTDDSETAGTTTSPDGARVHTASQVVARCLNRRHLLNVRLKSNKRRNFVNNRQITAPVCPKTAARLSDFIRFRKRSAEHLEHSSRQMSHSFCGRKAV